MSIAFITLMGVCVTSRVGSVAEGVHITIGSPMALAALAVHVVARDSIATEKAGGRVRDVRRDGKSAL